MLQTERLEELVPRLERAGFVFMTRPTAYLKTAASPSMPAGRYTETVFFDPDGVPVALFSYEPA